MGNGANITSHHLLTPTGIKSLPRLPCLRAMPEPDGSRPTGTQTCLGINQSDPVAGKQPQAGFAHSRNDRNRNSECNCDLSESLA